MDASNPNRELTLPMTRRQREVLDSLRGRSFNYDAARADQINAEHGWTFETAETVLPAEPPGPPAARGAFAVAREVLESCTFVDPAVIRAIFDPATPLLGRDLLLLVKPAPFVRLQFAARVVRVIDTSNAEESAWGYAYRTLEGHLEQGEICFSVHKRHADGTLRIRVERYYRMAPITNPIVRIGSRLVGPRQQRRYMRYVLRRIPELVAEGMASGAA